MFSYSDVALGRDVFLRISVFLDELLKKIVASNSFISSENWLLGDKGQPRHT